MPGPTQAPPGPGPVTDTRATDGPAGRVYAAAFATVWDLLLDDVGGRRGWELVHADEELGLLTVVCRAVPSLRDDLSVWVRLDENGLTRVDARAVTRSRWDPFGMGRRRVRGLLGRLDDALGPGARVRTGASGSAP
jgi:hypothetical protein